MTDLPKQDGRYFGHRSTGGRAVLVTAIRPHRLRHSPSLDLSTALITLTFLSLNVSTPVCSSRVTAGFWLFGGSIPNLGATHRPYQCRYAFRSKGQGVTNQFWTIIVRYRQHLRRHKSTRISSDVCVRCPVCQWYRTASVSRVSRSSASCVAR